MKGELKGKACWGEGKKFSVCGTQQQEGSGKIGTKRGWESGQRLDFESRVRYAGSDLRDGGECQGGFQERSNGIQLFVTESVQAALWGQSGTGNVAMGERKPTKNTMATAQARKEL